MNLLLKIKNSMKARKLERELDRLELLQEQAKTNEELEQVKEAQSLYDENNNKIQRPRKDRVRVIKENVQHKR